MKKEKSNKASIREKMIFSATKSAYDKLLSCCYHIYCNNLIALTPNEYAQKVKATLQSGNFEIYDFDKRKED